VYDIQVENPSHLCKGVCRVSVDRRDIAGQVVPAFADGKEHRVQVVIGKTGQEGGQTDHAG